MRNFKNCELCNRALTTEFTQKRGICLTCADHGNKVTVLRRKYWSSVQKKWIPALVQIVPKSFNLFEENV